LAGPGAIRSRYNSTNDAVIEDCAFIWTWRGIQWFYGSLVVRHCNFDAGIYGHVYLQRLKTRATVENCVATGASLVKNVNAGHLIVAEDIEGLRSDYNRFYFQSYDKTFHLFKYGRWPHKTEEMRSYQGGDGLKRWQQETGLDTHTKIVDSPGYADYSGKLSEDSPRPDGKPRWLDDFRLAPGSPLRGAASDGGDVGIRFPPE
jgi:hypothetical protein